MEDLKRAGSISIYGKLMRKDNPLVSSWVDGAKDALGGDAPVKKDDTGLIEVFVEFIRMLLCRISTSK